MVRSALSLAALSGFLALPAGLVAQSVEPAAAPREATRSAPGREEIRVHVKNDGWLNISVYAVVSGVPMYLGTVTGLRDDTFDFPEGWQATSDVRLLADPIGGVGHYLTEPLRLNTGDFVELRVTDDLRFSTVGILGPSAGR